MPTFLLTDIERSTQHWEKHRPEMDEAISRHDRILREIVNRHGGRVIKHTGDGIFAVFDGPNALGAALDIQRAIQRENWGVLGELRVRAAVHSGEAERHGDDYFGPVINRLARIMAAAWGGQVLFTPEARNVCHLPEGATANDLGTHLLKDLGEPQKIYSIDHPDLELHSFPFLRSLSAHPHNLPQQPTHFVGRHRELSEIHKHVQDSNCRLLSLVGIGGVGKTRLAIQAAAEVMERFPDGVYFVSLAALESADFFFLRMAEAIQLTFYSQEDPKTQMLNFLREKRVLLVLDHFDELVGHERPLTDILAQAPDVKILVTCRQRLRVQGEWVIEVEGLDYPKARKPTKKQYTSIQLFLEAAQRAKSDFTLKQSDIPFVVGICRLVQGLPLGLELASAWVRVLTCSEIQREIESNRDFLVSTTKGLPEEHKSLRAIFEYSWKILTEEERRVMEELSLFKSEFGREAAENICGTSLSILTDLADKSVLHRTLSGRYEIHQVIRQYSEEKLLARGHADPEGRRRFYGYYADYLHDRTEGRGERNQHETLQEVAEEVENIRESWRFAVELQDGKIVEKMLLGLFYYYELRGLFKEGELLFGDAITKLASVKDAASVVAQLRCRRAMLLIRRGLHDEAKRQLEQSLPLFVAAQDKRNEADCLNTLGIIAGTSGNHAQAKQYYLQAQLLFSESQDERGKAWSLNLQGTTEERLGNFAEARGLYMDALRLYEGIGDEYGVAWSLVNLGNIEIAIGSLDEARGHYKKSLRIYLRIHDQAGIASSLINLGRIDEAFGDYAMAARLHQRSRMIYQELGEQRGMTRALMLEGNALESMGRFEEAEQLFGQGLELSKALGDQSAVCRSLANLAGVRNQLADFKAAHDLFEKALRLARQIGEQDTIAWLLSNLGGIALATGDYNKAKQRFRESMEIYHGIGGRAGLAWVLVNFGDLQCQLGEYDEAGRLLDRGHGIYEEVGEKRGVAWSLMGTGNLAKARGDLSQARISYEQARQIYQETSDSRGLAWAMVCLGSTDVFENRIEQAASQLDEGLKVFRKLRDFRGVALALLGLANLKAAKRDFDGAESYLFEAATICEQVGAVPLHLDILLGFASLLAAKEMPRQAGEVLMHVLAHPCRKRETENAANRLLQQVAASVSKMPPTVRKPTVKSLRKILARDE